MDCCQIVGNCGQIVSRLWADCEQIVVRLWSDCGYIVHLASPLGKSTQ